MSPPDLLMTVSNVSYVGEPLSMVDQQGRLMYAIRCEAMRSMQGIMGAVDCWVFVRIFV